MDPQQTVTLDAHFCPYTLLSYQGLLYVGGQDLGDIGDEEREKEIAPFHVLNQNTLNTIGSSTLENMWSVHSFCIMPPFLIVGGNVASIAIWNMESREFVNYFHFDDENEEDEGAIKEIRLVSLLEKGINEIPRERYLLDTFALGISDQFVYCFHPFSDNSDSKKSEKLTKRILSQKNKTFTLCEGELLSFNFLKKNKA